MSLELSDVRQVAKLSRLDLTEAELTGMAAQLNRILDYVDTLQEVDTDGVEPLAHPLPLQNVFRGDVPTPSLTVEEALANAPQRAGAYFAVPAVFDTDEPVSH
jgi:aspartyl-tRNA(Asn)/glutamyl-tRNA(Gln) amidotransferase subunit C